MHNKTERAHNGVFLIKGVITNMFHCSSFEKSGFFFIKAGLLGQNKLVIVPEVNTYIAILSLLPIVLDVLVRTSGKKTQKPWKTHT